MYLSTVPINMRSTRNIHSEFNILELELKDIPNLNGLYVEECGFLIIDMDELPPASSDPHRELFINNSHTVLKLNFAGGLICKKGSISMKVNFKDIVMHENEVLACNSGMHVELMDISDDLNITLIAYADYGIFSDLSSRQFVLFNSYLATTDTMKIGATDIEKYMIVISMIKEFVRDPNFIGKREVIKHCTMIMIQEAYNSLILNNFEDRQQSGSRKGAICQEFLKLLERHYCDSRKVSFYADKLCLSPKHLSKTVLEGTGKHITEWIDGYVLMEAQTLLRSRKYTIQEVSDKLNFANQSFFGSWFKKATGMNPSTFMENE